MELKKIVIKNYQEFTEEVEIDLDISEHMTVAKEVEAVCQTFDDKFFSIGFSVMQNNPLFHVESPRDLVKQFILETFTQTGNNEPPSA